MHDVFVVTSQNWDGGRITRVIIRRPTKTTHAERIGTTIPDESIAAMATRCAQLMASRRRAGLARTGVGASKTRRDLRISGIFAEGLCGDQGQRTLSCWSWSPQS